MRNSTQDDLIKFYEQFYSERRKHFKRTWAGMGRFVLRIANRQSAFISSLKDDIHYMPSHLADFDLLVRGKEIDREEVVEFKDALKSQKEEFVGRSSYLIVFIALIVLFSKEVVIFSDFIFGDLLEGIIYKGLAINYVLNELINAGLMIYVIVTLVERDGINKRVSVCEQLCIVIDRWLDNNPKEEISVSGTSTEEPEEIAESFLEELVKEAKEENIEKAVK